MPYCQSGQTARVFVNSNLVGDFTAPITYQITNPIPSYWDYIFKGTVASSGCKTGYTVIYREPYDSYIMALDSRSGQSGSCSATVTDVRAKVSFGGQSYKSISYFGFTAPSGSANSHFYPNGIIGVNWHGSSVSAALPTLHSKTLYSQGRGYILKVFNSNNQVLFEQEYANNPIVAIECAGCPTGQLDCGDCCLPCDSVFNQISSLRLIVQRLR